MVKVIKGNIFNTKMQTIVNTINCVGVMGAGIAYEFKLREPKMFERYAQLCKEKQVSIGKLWLYKSDERWILNFPTKNHWRFPSKIEYLEKGLDKFVNTYKNKRIESIAFPLLGASNGGIPADKSLEIMETFLKKVEIPVEIYQYDSTVYDDLYLDFKEKWLSLSEENLKKVTGLRKNAITQITLALDNKEIKSLSRLLSVKGIGDKTLSKAFEFIKNFTKQENNPPTLF